jgi:DNA-binding NtrC family response regulator
MNGKGPILVVDDEEIMRDSLASWLEEDGFLVETAPDGPTALSKLAQRAYPIMLVDLKMPGMDGLHVLTEARKLQSDTAVILMTAYATVETAVKAMKQGAHDYLVKPFEPEELSQMVGDITKVQALQASASSRGEPPDSLKEAERRHIVASLRQYNWNISRTAKSLGIDRVTVYNKIKRYHIREDE